MTSEFKEGTICAIHSEKIAQILRELEKVNEFTDQFEEELEKHRVALDDVRQIAKINQNNLEHVPERLTGLLSNLATQLKHLKEEFTGLKEQMMDTYVKREEFLTFSIEFKTIKRAIYALLGILSAAIVGGIVTAVFRFFGL